MMQPARIRFALLALGCAVAVLPRVATAQSLADVARQEQARRKQQQTSGKVYTNLDLARDYTTPPSTTSADGSAPAPAATAPAPDAPADSAEPKKDQKFWQERISGARSQLERSKTFADALQTRVNSLSADFVNRDDPAQRAVIGQERLKTIAELERVQREVVQQTKAIAAIEDEARKAGVPAGWLR